MSSIDQTFVGIPSATPKITLHEALNRAVGTQNAKQIVVYYVLEEFSHNKATVRPVWVVCACGIPPFPPYGGPTESVPEDARNHLRTIIDAETGENYGSDTIPQPE